ncbi:hypothetical protein [Eubacterium sp. 1001713B170207_170306_E7]|uniref:hypothetical protein n=1 Tax=Eubacterium sp. 1001713B170207_170306_E7 TaxID=2787097 RepID=UPI001A9C12A3|nr:hypothetical protein [Eubacterium sp. 1001713B170207_170306_E7]
MNQVKKIIPRVDKLTLLVLAGAVWFIAGFNIMRIGTPDMIANWQGPLLPLLFSVIVFGLFFKFVFYKMVVRHSARIMNYGDEKVPFYRFFDKKSYLIMIFMITFGVTLRMSHVIPPLYLGIFYTGLGASLIGAGIFFFIQYRRNAVAVKA